MLRKLADHLRKSGDPAPRKTSAKVPKFSAAVQLHCAIIGMTCGSGLLPRELVNRAEHQIVVPPLDGRPQRQRDRDGYRHPSDQTDQRLAS
jgi:hypothetical protein